MANMLRNVVRGCLVIWVIVTSMIMFAAGRIRTLFVSDARDRRSAVARLQGKLLKEGLSRLGACFVKLGQVMSSRPDLFEPEVIAELRLLQDSMPPFPFRDVRHIVEAQLQQSIEGVFREFDPIPVAAASVAQVHRARLHSGLEVAVKVLRPNVRAQVERDGALLSAAARLLALHKDIKLSDPIGFTREFVAGLRRQTDLRIEAENYERFHTNFSSNEDLSFPLIDRTLSGEYVLTMEFVTGAKLDALPAQELLNRSRIASVLRNATMQMCFVDGFLHADMHPGNMVLRSDGKIVLFDVGLATELQPSTLDMFVDMLACIAMGTPDDMVEHLRRYHLHGSDVDWQRLHGDVGSFLSEFRARDVSRLDYGTLTGALLAISRDHRLRPVPELALLIIGIVTAQGLGKMLAPEVNDFQEMSSFLFPLLANRKAGVPSSVRALA